jgi:hypothetical protein
MALVNRAVAWRDDVRRTIGKDAALIVEQIIGGQPILKVATSMGARSGASQTRFAQQFRQSLEDIAFLWGRTGWPTGRPPF